MRNKPRISVLALVAVTAVALAAISTAGGAGAHKSRPSNSATPVFKLHLSPRHEEPRIRDLRADAAGHVTFDLTRNSAGAITSGEGIFYFNYRFPSSVTITGLHVHQGNRGTNGPIVIDSGVGSFTDADGQGNVTAVVASVPPATLQAILDNPRGYYVNLHTSVHPNGAMRDQLHRPKRR